MIPITKKKDLTHNVKTITLKGGTKGDWTYLLTKVDAGDSKVYIVNSWKKVDGVYVPMKQLDKMFLTVDSAMTYLRIMEDWHNEGRF